MQSSPEEPCGSLSSRSIFIFDSMRTRSHLFFRYLSANSKLHPIYHPYLMAAILGEQRWAKRAKCCEEREKEIMEGMKPLLTDETFESSNIKLMSGIEEARKDGTIPLLNDHLPNVLQEEVLYGLHRDSLTIRENFNPTHIPDSIFSSLTPVLLLRHPILQTDSSYRILSKYGFKNHPTDEDFLLHQSTKSARFLFDFFTKQGRQPIVVDGEDVVHRTSSLTKALCEKLDMELQPNQFSDVWEKTPEEKIPEHPLVKGFTSTIHSSIGIERPLGGKPESPNLDEWVLDWTTRYGAEIAVALKKAVERNMIDYEYLINFKI